MLYLKDEKKEISKEIVIFGGGKRCQQIIPMIEKYGIEIKCIVDNDKSKWGETVCGYKIESPSVLKRYQNICYMIAVYSLKIKGIIRTQLIDECGLSASKEIDYDELIFEIYHNQLMYQGKLKDLKIDVSKNRKTLFTLSSGMVLGGIETWTMGLCQQLEKEGTDIVIWAKKLKEDEVDTEKIEYVELENQNISSKNFNNILKRVMEHLPCTIIINQPDIFLLVACVLKSFLNEQIKIVSVIHGDMEENYVAFGNKDRYIDAYIVVSRDIERTLINRGIDAAKIKHMTCPVDCSQYVNHKYIVRNEETLRIGYAGRLVVKQKRIDLLILLIKKLEEMKVNYHFYVAGSGSDEWRLSELIEKEDLHNRVTLVGSLTQSEMPMFWSKMDICVNIADYEGRSISVMEAMGNGAVPVVTDVSGVNENITNNVNGYIVPIGNYEIMAERIKYIAEHKECLPIMGKNAHDEIAEDADMEKHIEFWKEVLASV